MIEVYFECQVESDTISDGQFDTPEDALGFAEKRFQELCDEGDYEYGRGDVVIFCIDAMSGKSLMQGEYKVFSEQDMDEKPYLQSEFV